MTILVSGNWEAFKSRLQRIVRILASCAALISFIVSEINRTLRGLQANDSAIFL